MANSDNKAFDMMTAAADKTAVELFPAEIDKNTEFDKKEFSNKAEQVRKETEYFLSKIHPNKKVEVKIGELERDIKTQEKYLESGASKTSLSLHNLGAAVDYNIFIDGEYQGGEIPRTLSPYKVLGAVARNKGLFWGWKDDARHVGYTRFVDEFFEKHPEQAEKPVVKNWYLSQDTSTNLSWAPIMSVLDTLYDRTNPGREYKGDPRTIDELLDTFNISI